MTDDIFALKCLDQPWNDLGFTRIPNDHAACPFHDGSDHFSIFKDADGCWRYKCHSGQGLDDDSGSIIDLWAHQQGLSDKDAIKELLRIYLGEDGQSPDVTIERPSRPDPVWPEPTDFDAGTPDLMETKDGRFEPGPWSHERGQLYFEEASFTDTVSVAYDGEPITIAICRWDLEDGSKFVRPFHKRPGDRAWSFKIGIPHHYRRPLYHFDELVEHPDRPMILVEGEKCMHALEDALLDAWLDPDFDHGPFVVTSVLQGTNSIPYTSFREVGQREVIFLPDLDEPGVKAIDKLRDKLEAFRVIWVDEKPDPMPESGGRDVADVLAEGYPAGYILEREVEWVTGEGEAEQDGRVSITLSGDLNDQVQCIKRWLAATNDPPHTYRRGRELVRLVHTGSGGRAIIDPLSRVTLSAHFTGFARFSKVTGSGDTKPLDSLPRKLAEFILAESNLPLPGLESVFRSPVYARGEDRDVQLRCETGYHSAAAAWLDMTGVEGVERPAKPSKKELDEAKAFIEDELLVDFPFDSAASKANAIGLGVLPFVRPLIDGPTPLHMLTAPTPGSGKGLLASVLATIAEGQPVSASPAPTTKAEWRKVITSTLLKSPSHVLIDNINEKMDSGALAAMLTTRYWGDRILGESRIVDLRNDAVWVTTANNPSFTGELARRMVLVRLEPEHERPEERTGFKHSNLRQFARSNRVKLVESFLTLVEHWLAEGQPEPTTTVGSFESWSEVVGGILESCGYEAFLGNRELLRSKGAHELEEWKGFVGAWHQEHGRKPVPSSDLRKLAESKSLLSDIIYSDSAKGRSTQMTNALKKKEGRVFGNLKIVEGKRDRSHNVSRWRLMDVG
jgi:hypothetical protein